MSASIDVLNINNPESYVCDVYNYEIGHSKLWIHAKKHGKFIHKENIFIIFSEVKNLFIGLVKMFLRIKINLNSANHLGLINKFIMKPMLKFARPFSLVSLSNSPFLSAWPVKNSPMIWFLVSSWA